MKLGNKIAIITGGGSGIGREIAMTFAREGARVCIADFNLNAAEGTARDIRDMGGTARADQMDVTVEVQVDKVIDDVVADYGSVDVLVSNAGIQHLDTLADVSFDDWKRVLAVHLDGSFLTTRACLRHMYRGGRGGSIILMGSVHSYMASEQKGPYVVAKHGLVGLCRTIAKEGARYGVRANTICPGFVRTDLIERQLPTLAAQRGISIDEVVNDFLRLTADGQATTEMDLAEVAVFLASFPTTVLTGQSISASHGIQML